MQEEPEQQPQDPQPGTNLPLPLTPPPTTALARHRGYFDEPEEEVVSLEHYIDVLRRRKWLLAAVALTVLFIAALQVFTATPLYKATATVQIDPEGQKVLPYEEVESGGGQLAQEEYLWTQAEKLQTRGLARRVIGKLELAENEAFTGDIRKGALLDFLGGARKLVSALIHGRPDEKDERALTTHFTESLQVRPLRNTRLIEVSFESPDAELAAAITNTITEEFIEQHLEGKFEATTRATAFLEKQLQDLQIKVEESEQALLRYAQQRNIVNLSDRENIGRKRLADLSDELTRAESELISQRSRYAAAQSATVESFPELLKTDAIRGNEARLSEMESDLAGMSNRYGSEWPTVKALRLEIEDLTQQLTNQKQLAISSARQDYELAQDRAARLRGAADRQRGLVDTLNEDSIQYNILRRESESNKELYEGLLQRLKEAGVSAGLRSSNVRVADGADVPRFAASPKKTRALALALILGLFLGTGAAFLAEALDNTVKTTEDVSQVLGLPSLGVVPHLALADNGGGWRAQLPGRKRHRRDGLPVLAFGDGKHKHRNRALEAYRSLRTSILLSHSGSPPQAIMVTSALPGEGKTTTSSNMAIALAQTGARTVLVDLDMRKPVLDKVMGIPADQGMSTYLTGNTDLSSQVRSTRFQNLYLVPAGPIAPNPAELIGGERMETGMKLLREYFTYVVIDTPPALEISDAAILSPRTDGVIVVARGGKTPKKALMRAAGQLINVGGRFLGVVINDVDVERSGYGYGYYYGSYGGYYGKYFDTESKSG